MATCLGSWSRIGWLAFVAAGCVTVHDPTPIAENGGDGAASAGSGSGPGGTGGSGGGFIQTDSGASSGGRGGNGSGGQGTVPTSQCTTSNQCSPPTPYCHASDGTCVECMTDYNCIGAAEHFCSHSTFTCVSCLSDNNCSATLPYCSPSGECVQCRTTLNCGTTGAVCDPATYRCVSTCGSDADCSSDLGRPYCDVTRSVCVQCLANDECPPITPRCDTKVGVCGQCAQDSDCSGATPRCDTTRHVCVGCLVSGDCAPGTTCIRSVCTAVM